MMMVISLCETIFKLRRNLDFWNFLQIKFDSRPGQTCDNLIFESRQNVSNASHRGDQLLNFSLHSIVASFLFSSATGGFKFDDSSYNFASQHETFQANMEANDDKPMAEPLNRTNKTPGRRSIPDS